MSSWDLYGNLIRTPFADKNEEFVRYARVIGNPLPRNPLYVRNMYGRMSSQAAAAAENLNASQKFTFKARLLETDTASPHDCLPQSCRIDRTPDPDKTVEISSCLIEVATTEDYYQEGGSVPKAGDVVIIRLEQGEYIGGALTRATLIGVTSDAGISGNAITDCTTAASIHDGTAPPPAAGPAIPSMAPPPPAPIAGDVFVMDDASKAQARSGPDQPPKNMVQIPGKNNWRSGRIESYHQMQVLRDKYNIRTIVNLAADSTSGQKSEGDMPGNKDAGCRGINYLTSRSKACEPIWAEEIFGTGHYKQWGLNAHSGFWRSDTKYKEIEAVLNQGNVLVHCTAGTDRTGGVVGRWLLTKKPTLTSDEILKYAYTFGKGLWCSSSDNNKMLRKFIFSQKDPGKGPC